MTKYLYYSFCNEQPLKIADLHTSKTGEVSTVNYIPGSSIRGAVISHMAKEASFEENKAKLFSDDIIFYNMYLVKGDGKIENNQVLIPSPKGYYEGKKENQKLQNVVVSESFDEGYKRASLGEYACFDGETIRYTSTKKGETLHIRLDSQRKAGKTDVFRGDFIRPGQIFQGYIQCDDERMLNDIKKILSTTCIRIGSSRSAGYGKLRWKDWKISEQRPFHIFCEKKPLQLEAYVYCLSNTTMRDDCGEICGLNLQELERRLGVSNLQIKTASSSIAKISGFNRVWKSRTPEYTMYAAGSVFKLTFDGEMSVERMRMVEEQGIGIKRSEGCGKILFLKGYEKIVKKAEFEQRPAIQNEISWAERKEEKLDLEIAAKYIYLNEIRVRQEQQLRKLQDYFNQITGSKKNFLINLLKSGTYVYSENMNVLFQELEYYLQHVNDKQDKKKKNNNNEIDIENIHKYFDLSLNELLDIESRTICGIPMEQILSEDEMNQKKIELAIEIMHYMNREG